MQRRSIVTIVCFSYAVYGAAVLWRALLAGIVRPHHHLGPRFVLAILGLLCYGMATRRRWAQGLGLFVGIDGAALGYAFSGFSSRSGEPTLSFFLVAAFLPGFLCSIALLALLAKPLPREERGRSPPGANGKPTRGVRLWWGRSSSPRSSKEYFRNRSYGIGSMPRSPGWIIGYCLHYRLTAVVS
jgi:hypothetical protein